MSTWNVPQPDAVSSKRLAEPASETDAKAGRVETTDQGAGGSVELFRHITNVTPSLLWVFDLQDRRCLYMNSRVTEVLGYAMHELRLDEETIHPQDRERVRANMDRLARMPEGEILEHRFRVRHAKKGWRWLSTRNVVLSRDSQGRTRQLLVVGEDITESKRMEAALRRANAELARSNKELEEVASLVAHDLRAPLVSLSGCATFLREEAGDTLSDECLEMLGYIEEGARQLGAMINSVLEYSRAGHARLEARACPMEELLRRTLRRLRADLDKSGARVTHDPLPLVDGDEELLGQLLQNLLENALKYRSSRTPEIHVGAREDDDCHVFWVRDNGIGIEAEYFERIFRVFERVRRGGSHPGGLGVGLATCKRVVEKHGGRIWVESAPGEGSTFYFALPRHQENIAPV